MKAIDSMQLTCGLAGIEFVRTGGQHLPVVTRDLPRSLHCSLKWLEFVGQVELFYYLQIYFFFLKTCFWTLSVNQPWGDNNAWR